MISITTISESFLSEIARIDCIQKPFFVALNTRDLSLLKETLLSNKRYPYSIQTSRVQMTAFSLLIENAVVVTKKTCSYYPRYLSVFLNAGNM